MSGWKFGQILDLLVKNAEPIWDPSPSILFEVRLDIEETPRQESKLSDFGLSSEVRRLMRQLDQIKDGKIAKIEIRDGIPRRLVAHLTAGGATSTLPVTAHPV